MEYQKRTIAWIIAFALILGMLPALPVAAAAAQPEAAEAVGAEAEHPPDVATDPQQDASLPAQTEGDDEKEDARSESENSASSPENQTEDGEIDAADQDTQSEDSLALATGSEEISEQAEDSDNSMTQEELRAALEDAKASGNGLSLNKQVILTEDMDISLGEDHQFVVMPGGAVTVSSGVTLTLNASTVLNGGTMTVESGGSLITQGFDVINSGLLLMNGAMTKNGASFILEGGVADIGGTLTSNAPLHVGYAGAGTLDVHGTLINYGYLNLCETGSLNVYGSLTNEVGENSYLDIRGGLSIPGTLTNKALMTVGSADVYVIPGGTMNVTSDAEVRVLEGGSLSANGTLNCDGSIIIEAGGALWVNDGGVATINGTLENHQWMHVGFHENGALDIHGTLINYGYLDIGETGNLNVYGNLTNEAGENSYLDIHGGLSVPGTLTNKALMTVGSADVYIIPGGTMNVTSGAEVYVLEGGSLSANGNLNCDGRMVIEAGGALWVNDGGVATINGTLENRQWMHVGFHETGTLTVNGTLTNYGYLNLCETGTVNVTGRLTNQAASETLFPFVEAHCPIQVSGTLENSCLITLNDPAKLQIQAGGQYAGAGDLAVYADTLEAVESFVPGLDLTHFNTEEVTDDSGHHWVLRKDTTTTVNNALDAIDPEAGAEEIKAAVQDINTEELKSAMLADEENTGTVAKLAELEERVGTTVVDTTNAPAFAQNEVSIVGAGLNNAVDSAEDIKLIVGASAETHELDAQYDSTKAFPFSMELENVENTDNLAVPVKITLPVPDSINPDLLVILHYHAGTVETIPFTISQNGGQCFVSFVLTGFSDFVMTQKLPDVSDTPGDVNGDGEVNGKDGVLLAQYLAGWDTPVNLGAADVNGDGDVNGKDGILLAQYLAGWDVILG